MNAPNSTMRLHRRQFIIGPEAYRVYDDWHCHQINAKTWLSYCPALRVGCTDDANNVPWVLLGLAVETREAFLEPLAQVAKTASNDVSSLYVHWAGRWVLIGADELHLDASGLLGCFYGQTDEGKTWVSSSAALLAKILKSDVDQRELVYEQGLSWFTPPRSRFLGIHRLLPSQVLQLSTGKIKSRPLMPKINPDLDYDKTLELLAQGLITALKRLSQKEDKLWLGLSAGADSRLILAMAYLGGINLQVFTRVAARMTVADRILPSKLASTLGYPHFLLKEKRQNQQNRFDIVAAHTGGHVSEGDALPFLQGVRDGLEGVSLGGWCFGVGKALGRKFLPDTVDDLELCVEKIAQNYQEPLTSSAIAGMREWLQWVQQTPQAYLDWRDRFYIEQRLAGWQSSKEQLYDLSKIERIPIINAAANYALMLGLAENQRQNAQYQTDVIARTVPQLASYPYNPNNRYFGILQAIAIRSSYDPSFLYRTITKKLSSWLRGK